MTTRQVLMAATVLGLVCAGVVWWLESFNRERLRADWTMFLEDWESRARGASTE